MASDDAVSPGEAGDALARVLESPEFAQAARLSAFLRYVVTEAVEGREAGIKGYSIAVDVFDRPADFDQSADPIVRVEASRLRRALAQYYQGSGASDPVVINLPRGGYIPLFRRRDGEASIPALIPPLPVPEPAPQPEAFPLPAEPRPVLLPGVRRFRAVMSLGLVLALGALGFLVWDAVTRPGTQQGMAGTGSAPRSGDAQHRPLIAVASLDNLGTDAGDTVIARGLTNEIVAELARFREIVVFALPPGAAQPAQGYVLSGSLRRSGRDIRVTMQLADAVKGETLWSETYDRIYAVDSLLSLQDDIARSVATAIAQPYGAVYERELGGTAASGPSSIEGYGCVMRAYEYWRTLDPAQHSIVRDCLEKTVASEPSYAAAWYALTFFYLDEYRYRFNRRAEYDPLDKALEAAQRAVALATTDARGYQALYAAYFYRGDFEGFKRAGGDALRLNPNNPEILADFGNRLAMTGAWDEGVALVRRAMAMNPGHPGWYYVPLSLDAYRRGKYPEALAFAERMNMPNFYRAWVFFAMIHGQMGDTARAAQDLERLKALSPEFAAHARDEMRRWGYRPDLIDLCMQGLIKAGMVVPGDG